MPIQTNFNTNPYFDDYNEEKDFLRILFRPGVAVQARELTQLQSIIQGQIERFGSHIFEEGSNVLGGQLTIDSEVQYLKLFSTYEANGSAEGPVINVSDFIGKTITQNGSNATARVVHAVPAVGNDFATLYIKSINSGAFNENTASVDATISFTETIDSADVTTSARVGGTQTGTGITIPSPIGTGSIASIDAGIFYINGFFTRCDSQTIALDKYGNNPTFRIGLSITESILDEFDDESLLDPANGSPNFTAPGAHRFSISLLLDKKTTDSLNFVELSRIDNGVIQSLKVNPIYSELGKQIARRTFDESGNYTTRPFNINLQPHPTLPSTKIRAALDNGKAYVHGYEYETTGTEVLDIDRSLDTNLVTDQQIYVRYGNYTIIDNPTGLFDISTQETINLYSTANVQTATLIGTASVISYTNNDTDSMRIYLRNFKMNNLTFTANTEAIEGGNTITLIGSSSTNNAYKGMTIEILGRKHRVLSQSGAILTVDGILAENGTSTQAVTLLPTRNNVSLFASSDGSKLALVSTKAKVSGVSSNDTIFSETNLNSLVFPLNDTYVKTLSDISYTYTKKGSLTFSSGTGQLSIASNEEVYPGTDTILGSDLERIIVFSDSTNVKQVVTSCSISGTTVTVNTANTSYAGASTIILPVTIANADERSKSLSNANTSAVVTETNNATLTRGQRLIKVPNKIPGVSESLLVSDVLRIRKIIDLGLTSIAADFDVDDETTWTEFTSTVYEESAADITTNYKFDNGQRNYIYDHANITLIQGRNIPTGPILVFFDYFVPNANPGFFNVDSYSSVDYEDIPVYIAQTSANSIKLSDAIDFRPVRDINSTSFDGGVQVPDPRFVFTTTYENYLSRIDKIILTKNRNFEVIKGISNEDPMPPTDLDTGMTLYTISLPPYTANTNLITVSNTDNRRYTMKDIGKLSSRIRSLETNAILSKIERETLDTTIFDDFGIEKFINGALVDNFTGHSIGDVENLDYDVSIDFSNREMRPPFKAEGYALDYDTLTNISNVNGYTTMDYTIDEFVSQSLASKSVNVNPYNVFNFNGSVKLTPSQDTWFDTNTRPAVSVNLGGDNDAWNSIGRAVEDNRRNGFGTEWNDWQTRWTGMQTSNSVISSNLNVEVDGRRVTATKSTTSEQVITRNQEEFRDATRTSFSTQSITRNLGSRIVDITVVPFIRSKSISFVIEGCKPNTRLYAFFDDTNISDSTGVVTTDASGKASGTFTLPGGVFRTGTRILRFIDREDNNVRLSDTKAEGTYSAQGSLATTEQIVATVREPIIRTQTVRESRPIPDVVTRSLTTSENVTTTWIDPLAQSFLVDPRIYPNGLYLSSVDLFFSTKDSNLPVTVQIRPTVNGYPSSSVILPGSEVILEAADVIIPTGSQVIPDPTSFAFENLVYLEPGEYTFVILSNSNQYEVLVGEIGQQSLNGNFLITENPYAGVMFKSQNASTWTAVQEDDIMFVLKKAVFATQTTSTVKIDVDVSDLTENKLYDLLQLSLTEFKPNGTNISYKFDYLDENDNVITQNSYVPNDNYSLRTSGKLSNSATSFTTTATLTSSDSSVSPVIDEETLNLIAISNNIDNGSIYNNTLILENGGTAYANTDTFTVTGGLIAAVVGIVTDGAGKILTLNVTQKGLGFTDTATVTYVGSTGSGAVIKVLNEGSNQGGNAISRYITRRVTLAKGFNSDYLQVRFKAFRPSGVNIDVYYKVLNANDTDKFDDKNYVKMELDPETDQLSTTMNDFREFIYKPKTETITYSSGGNNNDDNDYSDYNTFAVKIVLRSEKTTNYKIPRVRDLKVISFAS